MRIAEGGTDAEDVLHGGKQEIELTRRILDGERYVALPTSHDVHEWRIMEAFCYSLGHEDIRAAFLAAIRGRGAFRHFKDLLLRHGLRESWYAFRGEALRKIAIEWCEEHEIAFQA